MQKSLSSSFRQPLEAGKGKEADTPSEHPEGNIGSANTLILACDPFWVSEFKNGKTLDCVGGDLGLSNTRGI
jgi:hypothetical protein